MCQMFQSSILFFLKAYYEVDLHHDIQCMYNKSVTEALKFHVGMYYVARITHNSTFIHVKTSREFNWNSKSLVRFIKLS